jgi:hypothetical protein
MRTDSPFVLVHGAFQSAGTWDLVNPRLQASGRRAINATLTGLGTDAGALSEAVTIDTHIREDRRKSRRLGSIRCDSWTALFEWLVCRVSQSVGLLAEPSWDDHHLLLGDRTLTPTAVGQDSVDPVIATRQAAELEHDRGRCTLTLQRDLAAAIELVRLGNDLEGPVLGVRNQTRADVQV